MKQLAKIFLIAIPFAWLASISLSFFSQLGLGTWLVDSLSIRGYWPVSITFYAEEFFSALLTMIPYVGLVYFFVRNNRALTVATAIFAYMFFTLLFIFQKESLTASIFTLVQSANLSVYAAIFLLFAVFDSIWGQRKSSE